MAEPILTVEHLIKAYGETPVLDDISFAVKPGEVIVVVGPSGCGKSTLLRCLNGLEPTQSGRVRLGNETVAYGGKNLTQLRQRIGMVFQSVGKGYAVEMVCQAAEARGLTSALVSVGGNLRAIGVKPDGSQWTGGVENPWSSSDVYTSDSMLDGAINMSDMALVTSGDYQRYYVVDGKRYHHLIDPDTLFPAAYFNGVTVLCSDSGLADCLTTGLFCQPLEDGMKIVESLDGVEAMWCTPDQQVITSSGWDSHLKK